MSRLRVLKLFIVGRISPELRTAMRGLADMKSTMPLLALALLAGACSSSAAPSQATPRAPASPIASSSLATKEGSSVAATVVKCSLPADVCGDAVRAVEGLSALDAAGLPPVAVSILDMGQCRSVTDAPKGYDPCAAAIPMPAQPSAVGGGDGLATVTYRDGLGKAFIYIWWRTFPSGRGPVNAVVEASGP